MEIKKPSNQTEETSDNISDKELINSKYKKQDNQNVEEIDIKNENLDNINEIKEENTASIPNNKITENVDGIFEINTSALESVKSNESNKSKKETPKNSSKKLTKQYFDEALDIQRKYISNFLSNLSHDVNKMNTQVKNLTSKLTYIESRLNDYENKVESVELNIDEFIEIFGSKQPTNSVNVNKVLLEKVLEHNQEKNLISSKNKSAAVNTALLIALYKSNYRK